MDEPAVAALALVLLGCATTRGADAPAAARDDFDLAVSVSVPSEVAAGRPVPLSFRIENRGASPVWVLKWYTPLEGLRGRALRVTREGVEVDYRGPLFKRADPTRSDYVRIEGHSQASAEVDLALAYDLTAPGAYRVEFEGRLHDVCGSESDVPRARARHRELLLVGAAAAFHVRAP
jgi:hypothetical protein